MRNIALVALLSVFALAALSGPLCASGGMYVDDLSIKNNGQVVFSDSFDNGNVNNWFMVGCNFDSTHYNSANSSIHFDGMGTGATRAMSMPQVGAVEVSTWIYMPSVGEQYNSTKSVSYCRIGLWNDVRDLVSMGVELFPNELGYRVNVWTGHGVSTDRYLDTRNWVLGSGCWNKLTLRMDPSNSTVSTLLNDQQQASITYEPNAYQGFTNFSINSGFASVPTPEPSSILALLAGLGGIGGIVVRKRR